MKCPSPAIISALLGLLLLPTVHASVGEVELLSKSSEKDKRGITLAQAQALCESTKKLQEGQFFIVYCKYHNKKWTEIETRQGYRTESHIVGYKSVHVSYHSEHSVRVSGEAYYSQERDSQHYEKWRQEPIVQSYSYVVPYEVAVEHGAFGLSVYGVGKLSEISEKVLFQATGDFESAELAVRSCLQMKTLNDEQSLKYYKSRCEAVPYVSGFGYRILSKNPYYEGALL